MNQGYASDRSEDEESVCTPRRRKSDFVILVVRGPGSVQKFKQSFPSHIDRCRLAKNIHVMGTSKQQHYSIELLRFDMQMQSAFLQLLDGLIPEANRQDQWFYDVSDFDKYDYSAAPEELDEPEEAICCTPPRARPLGPTRIHELNSSAPSSGSASGLTATTVEDEPMAPSSTHTSPIKPVGKPFAHRFSSATSSPVRPNKRRLIDAMGSPGIRALHTADATIRLMQGIEP